MRDIMLPVAYYLEKVMEHNLYKEIPNPDEADDGTEIDWARERLAARLLGGEVRDVKKENESRED